MALASGARLGAYEIVTLIGSGGMGEVYRAKDTKLGREVALKILSAMVTDDPERLARFRREAQVLAALNHPHIGAIYGLEETDGIQFLVLELVEGESLDKRIARGRIPVDESLSIATQIAEALEAAHEKGIIHRDLKPANVALTRDGKAKVLDFGLAKATEPAAATSLDLTNSPTNVSPALTRIGVIVGTAAYMSPEQARGLPVDKRTDVWAFGCVLFEMLTATPAFAGATVSDMMAAILERQPAFERLPPTTPPSVRRLLSRCLTKDTKKRLRDLGDARIDIDDVLTRSREEQPAIRREGRRSRAVILASLMLTAVGGALVGWSVARPTTNPGRSGGVARLAVVPPEPVAGVEEAIAISPDGKRLAYVAGANRTRRIFLRDIDRYDSTAVPGTEGAEGVVFSDDGRSLALIADRKLKTVLIGGGTPITVREPMFGRGFESVADGSILFNPAIGVGLWRVRPEGDATEVTKLDPHEDQHRFPQLLPGERAVLYSAWSGGGMADDQVFVQIVATAQRRPLVKGTGARYLPTGHLVYVRAGSLFAAPFDIEKLELTGNPVSVLEGVRQSAAGTPQISFSREGTLAYISASPIVAQRSLVWVDRHGAERPAGEFDRTIAQPRISPDGRRVAVVTKGEPDIWQLELSRGAWTRMTFNGSSSFPLWRPDGQLTFSSGKSGPYNVYVRTASTDERLFAAPRSSYPLSWSPDGRALAFVSLGSESAQDVWLYDANGRHDTRGFLTTTFAEGAPVFSPDGQSVAYVSNMSGRPEIYVRSTTGGEAVMVSVGGGLEPVWPRNSRELFYRIGDAVMAVEVAADHVLHAGRPKLVFEGNYEHSAAYWANYDVDSRGFLMIKRMTQDTQPAEIRVITNWFEELKARVPTR